VVKTENREFWLRGPVPGISPLLQPIAHALLQAREEVTALMEGFPEEQVWNRPAEIASPGFHLQHLAGVLDRLFTYARGEPLSGQQLQDLAREGSPGPGMDTIPDLLGRFHRQVDQALEQLAATPEMTLVQPRGVGRAQIPSTVGGLLFHAAEHTQRHTGQLLVTIKVLLAEHTGNPWEQKGV
jgi:uncharacterized damage-inducible protein DinB